MFLSFVKNIIMRFLRLLYFVFIRILVLFYFSSQILYFLFEIKFLRFKFFVFSIRPFFLRRYNKDILLENRKFVLKHRYMLGLYCGRAMLDNKFFNGGE